MSEHTAQAARKPVVWRWPRTEERYGREFSGGWAYEEDYDSIPTWVKYNGDDIEPLYAEALANSHADLVEALEEARPFLKYMQEKHGYATGETILARIDEVLAKVKEIVIMSLDPPQGHIKR